MFKSKVGLIRLASKVKVSNLSFDHYDEKLKRTGKKSELQKCCKDKLQIKLLKIQIKTIF